MSGQAQGTCDAIRAPGPIKPETRRTWRERTRNTRRMYAVSEGQSARVGRRTDGVVVDDPRDNTSKLHDIAKPDRRRTLTALAAEDVDKWWRA